MFRFKFCLVKLKLKLILKKSRKSCADFLNEAKKKAICWFIDMIYAFETSFIHFIWYNLKLIESRAVVCIFDFISLHFRSPQNGMRKLKTRNEQQQHKNGVKLIFNLKMFIAVRGWLWWITFWKIDANLTCHRKSNTKTPNRRSMQFIVFTRTRQIVM